LNNLDSVECTAPTEIELMIPQCYIKHTKEGLETLNSSCTVETGIILSAKKQCDGGHACNFILTDQQKRYCIDYNLNIDVVYKCLEGDFGSLEEESMIWVIFLCLAIFLFLFVVVDMTLYQSNRGCIHRCQVFCCSDYEEIDSGLADSREDWVTRKR